MPNVKVTVSVEIDGQPISGFPVVRRLEVSEVQAFDYIQPNHGDDTTFSGVPADLLDTIRALVVRVDQDMTLRLNGQTDTGIALKSGGLIIVLDGELDAGAGSANASLNNNSGEQAVVRGLAGGE